jgi:hypothetical protein
VTRVWAYGKLAPFSLQEVLALGLNASQGFRSESQLAPATFRAKASSASTVKC